MNRFSTLSLRGGLALAVVTAAFGCAPMSANDHEEINNGATLCLLPSQAYTNGASREGADSAVMIRAELAKDHEQQARGLMHREHLAEDEGMLFYYPQSDYRRFWMFQTLIALDIAFLNERGRILQIETMEPCLSSNPRHCPGYQSTDAVRAALELNGGAFEDFDIKVGDYVLDAACEKSPWAEGW